MCKQGPWARNRRCSFSLVHLSQTCWCHTWELSIQTFQGQWICSIVTWLPCGCAAQCSTLGALSWSILQGISLAPIWWHHWLPSLHFVWCYCPRLMFACQYSSSQEFEGAFCKGLSTLLSLLCMLGAVDCWIDNLVACAFRTAEEVSGKSIGQLTSIHDEGDDHDRVWVPFLKLWLHSFFSC